MNILRQTDHRPWPLPRGPWVLHMRWAHLAFLHWAISPEALRPLIPAGLELDTFDGQAWIGVVPFRMENVHARLFPGIPTATNFPELNVRTYVRGKDRAGVWFMSLDAASRLAVSAARIGAFLPYFDAKMSLVNEGEEVVYASCRDHRGAPSAEFRARYGPTGPVTAYEPGSLERWLTERYCLFSARRDGKLFRVEVHHLPWPLRPAEAEIEVNTMVAAAGLALPDEPPLAHFADSLDVVAWPPVAL